jgi:outer membrane protein OmpA-like peptidoglycan-associated protein
MKLLRYILLISLFNSLAVIAGDRDTPYFISGGIGLNMNIYSSDFSQLPGIENCCNSFESASGFAPYFFIGGEYKFPNGLFEIPSRYGLQIGYNNLSADYNVREFIGNDLLENEYRPIYTENRLYPEISMLYLDNYLAFRPLDLPLDFTAGFKFGMITTSDVMQEEQIVEPSGKTFEETGTNKINEYSGEIPDASSIFAGISAGARYLAYRRDNWEFYPHLQFEYGLNNLVSSLDWKAYSLKAGITVMMNIPGKAPEPPRKPPMPDIPEPPSPPQLAELDFETVLKTGNTRIKDGGDINSVVTITSSRSSYSVPGVFFFGQNSARPMTIESAVNRNDGIELQGIAPESDLRIVSYFHDEEESIASARISAIKEYLKIAGINTDEIPTRTVKIDSEFRYPELSEESRKIELLSAGKPVMMEFGRTLRDTSSEMISLSGEIINLEGNEPFNTGLSISIDGNELTSGKSNSITTSVNPEKYISVPGKKKILLNASASDSENRSKSAEISATLNINVVYDNKTLNVSEGFSLPPRSLILGYFDFDESEFSLINRTAVDEARKESAKGTTILIYPLTDNLGTDEYNNSLARKRAEAARKALGLPEGSIKVVFGHNISFNNQSPLGRSLNRSIIIRFE